VKSDAPKDIPKLAKYGEEMARKILAGETDKALEIKAKRTESSL